MAQFLSVEKKIVKRTVNRKSDYGFNDRKENIAKVGGDTCKMQCIFIIVAIILTQSFAFAVADHRCEIEREKKSDV